MPVDKGGIDYPIRAFDEFSATFADFRAQVAANRQEWAAFRAETSKGGVSAARVNASLRSLQAQAVALSGVTQQIRLQAQALASLNAANKGVPVSSIKIDNSVKQYIREAPAQFREANVEATKFNSTIGRIVRALVLFAAIRQAGSALASFVGGMVKFNAEIENVTLGIAAVVSAVGTVRTAAGGAVSATAALALGQKEAARQTRLLRQDALSTTASFEDLALAFQTAIAPGLNAGLSLDQVRKFAVQISQAATAIGLSQNQLAEEIRSILAGTIQTRTTRIATALGITNEDIRRAKEAGTLADFLNKRFAAFTEAGKEAQGTFAGLSNRLKTGFQLVLASGGLEYFEKVKALLADLFNLVATKNPLTGIIEPNPTAIAFVQEIGKGLSAAVEEVNRLRSVLTGEEVVGFATTIGQGIKLFVTFLGAAIEGIIRASAVIQPVILAIVNAFNNNPGLAKLVTGLVAALTLSKAISFAFGEVGSVLGVVATTMRVLTSTISLTTLGLSAAGGAASSLLTIGRSLLSVFFAMGSPVGLVFALTVAIGIATQSWLSDLTGVDLKYSSILKISQDFVGNALAASKELAALGVEQAKLVSSLAATSDANEQKRLFAQLELNARNIRNLLSQAGKQVKDDFDQVVKDNDKAPSFVDSLVGALKPAKEALSKLFGDPLAGSEKLSKTLADLPPVISRSSDALAQNGKLLETLTKKAEKLKNAFAVSRQATGLSGAVLEQFRASTDAADDLRSSLRGLTAEQKAAQASLLDIQKKRATNEIALSNINDKEKSVVESILASYVDMEALQRLLSIDTTKLVLAQEELLTAQKTGDADAVQTAKDKVQGIKDQIDALTKQNEQLASSIDLQVESVGTDRAAALKKLIADRIQLEGQEKGVLADINSLTQGRAELEGLAARNVALQQAATAEAEIFKLRRDTSKIILEADQAEAEFALRNARDEERAATFLQIKLALSRLTVEQAEILRAKEVATLESLIAQNEARRAALSKTLGNNLEDPEKERQIKEEIAALDQAIASLEGQKGSVIKQNAELRRKETEELKLQTAEVEKARIAAELPVGAGIVQGLTDAFKASEFSFQNTINFMRSTVESFASFVSSSIVDAFDPNSNTDAQERFAAFLRGLAAQIIQTLVTLAVTAAALNAASDGLLGPTLALYAKSQGFKGFGFVKGGKVQDAFQHAEGRAYGGRPSGRRVHGVSRPSGLHPRDTVPIWADPSEWIITGSVTQRLGDAFMQKLNNGELDPMALRAFAGVSGSSSRTSRANSMGMVLGGSVAEAAAASAARSAAQSNSLTTGNQQQSNGAVVAAYIQPGPGVASGLMKGDVNGVLRFLADNRRDVKGALGVQ